MATRRLSEIVSVACRPISFPPSLPLHTTMTTAPPTTDPPTTPPAGMTYWVTFSRKIHPRTSHAVSVYVANVTGPVTLQLDLMDYDGKKLQDGQEFTLPAKGRCQSQKGWLVGCLVGWLVGWLIGWLVSWLVG